MPTVEGLQFGYALHELPAGRLPFVRWRWEVWHGSTLLAAGWRVQRRHAERAVRGYAAAQAHRLFGLRPPTAVGDGPLPAGAAARVETGAVVFSLLPRTVAEEQRRAALAR